MKHITKQIVAIYIGLLFMVGSVVAQPGLTEPQHQGLAPAMDMVESSMPHNPLHERMASINIASSKVCYVPGMRGFVIIDSIDCAVDLLVWDGDTVSRLGRFTTDIYRGRHDLKKILRPVSVYAMDDKILVLASSSKDSSFLAVLSTEPVKCNDKFGYDTLKPLVQIGFRNTSFAFEVNEKDHEIYVVGESPVGYAINFLSYPETLEQIGLAYNFDYHVLKQSERIQASDPHGAGLAIVAIMVVFSALVCIFFIMDRYGTLITKIQDRRSKKSAAKDEGTTPTKSKDVAGEVYAAIAAAIYAYDADLHDDEETVITIQKVERAWTPWNAKFYNMNQYFSTRK